MYWITRVWPFQKLGKITYFHGNRFSNKIALTFDDGPSDQTINILEVLNRYGVRATFFVLGDKVKRYKKEIKSIQKQGSEIGNHSYNHPSLLFKSKREIDKQIAATDVELGKIGVKTNLFRPPHGNFGINLISVANPLGKKLILWDVDPKDWSSPGKRKVVEYILKNVKKGSIIDLHEYAQGIGRNNDLIQILQEVIPQLQDKGYQLVTVSGLYRFKQPKSK